MVAMGAECDWSKILVKSKFQAFGPTTNIKRDTAQKQALQISPNSTLGLVLLQHEVIQSRTLRLNIVCRQLASNRKDPNTLDQIFAP